VTIPTKRIAERNASQNETHRRTKRIAERNASQNETHRRTKRIAERLLVDGDDGVICGAKANHKIDMDERWVHRHAYSSTVITE
jgi:hypothetical protein